MRKTALLIFACLLLVPIGCSSPAASGTAGTGSAAATLGSATVTSRTTAAAPGPKLESRPPLPAWARPYEGIATLGVITNKPQVALTIDDVGAAEMKPLVDALVANKLPATLFCIGSQMTTEAAAYAGAHAADGIELGDHSWIHNSIGHYAPVPANEQIMRTARLLEAGTGVWPVWYRSPFNLYHSQGMRSVAAAGMLVAIDSNDPLDYHGYFGKQLVDRIDVKLKPGQIILLHHYAKTIDTLPAIAAMLHQRGYTVLNLTELAQTGKPATQASQLDPGHGGSDFLTRVRLRLMRLFGR
jgi:peptidoglycan/xylan/chitin deacetylase (PgdA/CDA1 family)